MQLRWAFVAAAAAATIVGFVMLSSQGSPDVLFSTNHKLNPQEKQFVKRVSLFLLSFVQLRHVVGFE